MNISIQKNSRDFLAALAVVFGVCAATGVGAQELPDRPIMNKKPEPTDKSKPRSGTRDGPTTVQVPILMLVPVEVSTDLERKGCWVKFYEKKNYEGDSLTLAGPLNLPRLIGPFGSDWENKVRSLKTGPRAGVTIYDNRDFRDQNKFIEANGSVPDMSEKMGFFDDFRSMMLSCK
ncbi:beta/gamma crystallin domain-containing protein [Nitrosovibrio sp. Nv4]|uniref:beta/gamma crystallin domain-containing protein n=1 Tax=Nitrosovibrio sp. Nv4 TaxID=1945880 RepID=UPI000BD08ACB|nr:beta/gamma crystallin domain-containing protein [Nitrosovibrio sp. Nv4]SOD41148.1 Beta/Gamma crystallin [Nitrosovibrio sp. Nv4]